MTSKKDEQFWLEQHSWGDFPFDKPTVNVNVNVTDKNDKKHDIYKQIQRFVKELCNTDMSEKTMRYPLL